MSDNSNGQASGRRMTLNVLWNFLGTGAPLLVGLVAIPVLLGELGTERFGVLALAWMIVGYFSLFDLGLGRALTQKLAQTLGRREFDQIPALFWTAISLMASLGVLGAIVAASLTPWLIRDVLQVPAELKAETMTSFFILAFSIPVVICTAGLRGTLEAYQRFDLINAVRIPLGVFTFLGPLMVLPFSRSLPAVIGVLAGARLLSWVAYAGLCLFVEPSIRRVAGLDRRLLRPLFSFGGWMTVTNIVGPLMVYMDRFLIGAVVSLTAVAYYATPFEVVTKLFVVPAAIMGVLFPAFASTLGVDRAAAAHMFNRVVEYISLVLFPITLIVVMFAEQGLTIWLDSEFAANSALVMQLLMVGVFINSHAQVAFGLIQGAGRPDLTAMLHLLELPLYVALLWWLLNSFGIVGAAAAWVVRIAIDTVLLFVLSARTLRPEYLISLRWAANILIALVLMAVGALIPGTSAKVLYASAVLGVFCFVGWNVILDSSERAAIRGFLARP